MTSQAPRTERRPQRPDGTEAAGQGRGTPPVERMGPPRRRVG